MNNDWERAIAFMIYGPAVVALVFGCCAGGALMALWRAVTP